MMTWIVAIHDRTLYYRAFLRHIMSAIFIAVPPPPPPKKKKRCVHVGVLSQCFESGTSLFMSKRSFFAFNFQAVLAM